VPPPPFFTPSPALPLGPVPISRFRAPLPPPLNNSTPLPAPAALPRPSADVDAAAADRAALTAALADPDAAADSYFASQRAVLAAAAASGHPIPAGLELLDAGGPARRRRIFKASLRAAARLNTAARGEAAYGITPFMHLTAAEFSRLVVPRVREPVRPAAVSPDDGPRGLGPEPGLWDLEYCSEKWLKFGAVPEVQGKALTAPIDWRASDPPRVTPVKWQGFVSPRGWKGRAGHCWRVH
jgi:hypothetical protein